MHIVIYITFALAIGVLFAAVNTAAHARNANSSRIKAIENYIMLRDRACIDFSKYEQIEIR